ncbi:unnamed protein product [Fraxinus pennsylvanica]|uniref:Uncharacterized protein n=1 Tax=Fraxinus pennsylvanica TaxID=56036 RepID=A0AAD2E618_9LAMI|nr:unnamed protein product [Fraxinus pennsylvanica]
MGLKNPRIEEADLEFSLVVDTLAEVTPVVDTLADTLVEVTPVVDMEENEVDMVVDGATAAMAAVARAITLTGVAGAVDMLVRQWMLNLTTKTYLRSAVFFDVVVS